MKTNFRSAMWKLVRPDWRRIAFYALVSVLTAAAVLSVGAGFILGQQDNPVRTGQNRTGPSGWAGSGMTHVRCCGRRHRLPKKIFESF